MEDRLIRAQRYRQRAKQIRTIAADVRGEPERRRLDSAAREFEQLADELEGRKNSKLKP